MRSGNMASPDPEFIRRLEELVGDNPTEFARQVGIPQPSLHAYLSGKYAPGFDFFATLAKHGVNVNWLLTGQASKDLETGFSKSKNGESLKISRRISVLIADLEPHDAQVVLKTIKTLVESLRGKKK